MYIRPAEPGLLMGLPGRGLHRLVNWSLLAEGAKV